MSDPILPLAVWAPGTNQNSIPANDNALRLAILTGLIISDSVDAQPGSPAEGDAYIITGAATGAQWATFDEFDLAIYDGAGTWHAYAPVDGIVVNVNGTLKRWTGAAYVAFVAPLASPTFTGDHTVSEADFLTGVISPTQIAANTNNYAPTGFATCSQIRITSDACRAITGLAGGAAGRQVSVYNVGSHDILLSNEDTGSTAANRFAIRRGLIVPPNTSVTLWYDATSSRWRQKSDRNRQCLTLLAADVINADAVADTLADITGLSFAVLAGKRYKFQFRIGYDAAASTTGARFTINGPALTTLYFRSTWPTSATGVRNQGYGANIYDGGTVGASSMVDGNFAEIWGVIVPSADGVVVARFASEVAGSALTARAGVSFVEYECISP